MKAVFLRGGRVSQDTILNFAKQILPVRIQA